MKLSRRCFWLLLAIIFIYETARSADPAEAFWPQWRGPLCNGFSPTADPPLAWSETQGVKWKVKTPGSGTATPIVWGNKVFLLSAVPTGNKAENGKEILRYVVLCYDRASGKLAWEKTVQEEAPHESHHPDHGYASGSPATDGEHLIAYFGSRGLHGLTLEGEVLWSKDLGRMRTRNSFGEGASATLYKNTVVVAWDDENDNDFIAAFEKATGKELWRTPRKETTGWTTPLVVNYQGQAQVIVNASDRVRSYDLSTGKELWQCGGQTANPIPTPVASEDTVYVTSGFRGNALFAIGLGRTGELTGTDAIRWSLNKNTPYVPSPLLVNGRLYLVTGNNGVLSCFEAGTGKAHFVGEKLEGIQGIYASPVSAKGRVYALGRDGSCLVLKEGPTLEVLSRNKLDDKTDATPALAGREIFIRGHQQLYCLSTE